MDSSGPFEKDARDVGDCPATHAQMGGCLLSSRSRDGCASSGSFSESWKLLKRFVHFCGRHVGPFTGTCDHARTAPSLSSLSPSAAAAAVKLHTFAISGWAFCCFAFCCAVLLVAPEWCIFVQVTRQREIVERMKPPCLHSSTHGGQRRAMMSPHVPRNLTTKSPYTT